MASSPSSMASFKFLLSTLVTIIWISCSLKRSNAKRNFDTVEISSILPSLTCKPSSSTGPGGNSTLKIVDGNGPCHDGESSKLTLAEMLDRDQSRVASIQKRHTSSSITSNITDEKTAIPARSGASLGAGNYIVSVGIGTPRKNYNLIFDTGSDLTWTQCQPCSISCYTQNDPFYNPSGSSTYSGISCDSPICDLLIDGTGNFPGCSDSTCVYDIQYGDGSSSIGLFATETLTLGTDAFTGYAFGCGQDNQGLFGRVDGMLGLGQSAISVVSQTAPYYGKVFSYCLPSSSGSNGYLSFGKRGIPKSVKFTPFSMFQSNDNFYFIDTVGISVGGRLLPISASVFRTAGTIVDSGTVITRLPPTAYAALSSAFRQQMTKYKRAPAFSILDTCYDFSGLSSINIPIISFIFRGNLKVNLGVKNVILGPSISQICLAFAGNNAGTDFGIFGNKQQQTMQMVFDLAVGRVGFGAGGCS